MANCPKCGFAGASFTHDGARKCAKCGEVYRTGLQYPSPPVYSTPVVRSGNNRRAMLIAVAVGVAITALAGFFVSLESAPGGPPESDGDLAPVAQTDSSSSAEIEPENGTLSATVTPVLEGLNGSSPWWLLKYRNTGEVTISRPAVLGTFTADGRQLKSQSFPGTVYSVPPGGEIWIRVVPGLSRAAEATFRVGKLERTSSYTTMYRQLEVVSHDAKQTSGKYSTVSGRVRNQTNEKSTSVHVFAVGYDSTGAACSFVDAYVSGSGIEPGAEGEFKLYAGIWQTELPKRWELTAWGRVTK